MYVHIQVLALVDRVHGLVGTGLMRLGSRLAAPITGVHWNPYLPASAPALAYQDKVGVWVCGCG